MPGHLVALPAGLASIGVLAESLSPASLLDSQLAAMETPTADERAVILTEDDGAPGSLVDPVLAGP